MKVWITHSGETEQAVVNPLKAVREELGLVPDKVIILTGSVGRTDVKEKAEIVKSKIGKDLGIMNVVVHPFDESNLNSYLELLKEILKNNLHNEVYLDITPGRKYMSLFLGYYGATLALKRRGNIKGIFYLHLLDPRTYRNAEYEEIPKDKQILIDLLKYTFY